MPVIARFCKILILAKNAEIMHLISTLKLVKTPQKLCIQQTSKRQKQLPYLHHCAHVLGVGHNGVTISRQNDFVT